MTFIETYEQRARQLEMLKAWRGNRNYIKLSGWLARNRERYFKELSEVNVTNKIK